MKRNINNIINEEIKNLNEVTLETVIEIIKVYAPYENQDVTKLIERDLKRQARLRISRIKDEKGIRTYFSDNVGTYVNVETTNSTDALKGVKKQLNKKYAGLAKARKKVERRENVLEGQLSLFDML